MVRVSIPGGTLNAEQYLSMDKLCDAVADVPSSVECGWRPGVDQAASSSELGCDSVGGVRVEGGAERG
jgi:hypothetical protein